MVKKDVRHGLSALNGIERKLIEIVESQRITFQPTTAIQSRLIRIELDCILQNLIVQPFGYVDVSRQVKASQQRRNGIVEPKERIALLAVRSVCPDLGF